MSLTIITIAIIYIALTSVALRIFHVMRDRNISEPEHYNQEDLEINPSVLYQDRNQTKAENYALCVN